MRYAEKMATTAPVGIVGVVGVRAFAASMNIRPFLLSFPQVTPHCGLILRQKKAPHNAELHGEIDPKG
jgi:hypothetical protein